MEAVSNGWHSIVTAMEPPSSYSLKIDMADKTTDDDGRTTDGRTDGRTTTTDDDDDGRTTV